ncbi:MAG: S1-like domain-containing RNA-binding protein [Rikenellaceae bacterium]
MIISGIVNSLKITRFTDNGAYLADEEGAEVLLPNRYLKEGMEIDEELDVFVYHDSIDRQVAVTDRPLAMVGEVAYLEVVDNNAIGAFVDWGLPKNLLIPKRNQLFDLQVGKRYIIAVYHDAASGRVVGTTKLNRYIYNDDIDLNIGKKVEVLVAIRADYGYRVIIENRHWGVIYSDQTFQRIEVGDRLTGYVRKITEDNRIDISLRTEGLTLMKESSEVVEAYLKEHDGFVALNDNSSPDDIAITLNMSKKSFKKAVGILLKAQTIEFHENGIRLKSKEQE